MINRLFAMRFAEYKKLDLVAVGNEIREKW